MNAPATRRSLAALAFLVATGILATLAAFGAFSSSSVCSLCGAIRQSTEWEIPTTRITVFRHSSEQASPVSAVLVTNHIVGIHQHRWLFSHGGGNGVTCAIGEGRHIQPVVQSESVAKIIEASHQFGEVSFRDYLLQALFDPKTSEAVRGLGMNVPTNRFPDSSAFRSWLSKERWAFDESVAMYRKR